MRTAGKYYYFTYNIFKAFFKYVFKCLVLDKFRTAEEFSILLHLSVAIPCFIKALKIDNFRCGISGKLNKLCKCFVDCWHKMTMENHISFHLTKLIDLLLQLR